MDKELQAEYAALTRGAGIVTRPHRALLEVSGADRRVFLQRLLSNDVEALDEGCGREAMLLTPKGMLIAHMVVYERGNRSWIDLPGETREEVAKKLGMYVLSADVLIDDLTDAQALIGVHGPESASVLSGLIEGDLPAGLYDHRAATIAGVEAHLSRVEYLGREGYDLHHSAGASGDLSSALAAAGAKPVGVHAAEVVRIEAGVAAFGAEMTAGLLPPEVPALVDRAISYEKGCFVGQETISRLKTYGRVNRELRGLILGGDRVPQAGSVVRRSDKKIGVLTSACAVPGRERPIALAFIHRKHFETGTTVEVVMEGGVALATVVPAGGT